MPPRWAFWGEDAEGGRGSLERGSQLPVSGLRRPEAVGAVETRGSQGQRGACAGTQPPLAPRLPAAQEPASRLLGVRGAAAASTPPSPGRAPSRDNDLWVGGGVHATVWSVGAQQRCPLQQRPQRFPQSPSEARIQVFLASSRGLPKVLPGLARTWALPVQGGAGLWILACAQGPRRRSGTSSLRSSASPGQVASIPSAWGQGRRQDRPGKARQSRRGPGESPCGGCRRGGRAATAALEDAVPSPAGLGVGAAQGARRPRCAQALGSPPRALSCSGRLCAPTFPECGIAG